MEQKDYVSYEVAKLLKGKGYHEPCDSYIEEKPDGIICWNCIHELKQKVANGEYLRPTLGDVFMWLIREKKIYVQLTIDEDEANKYFITVYDISDEVPRYIFGLAKVGIFKECFDYAIRQGLLVS